LKKWLEVVKMELPVVGLGRVVGEVSAKCWWKRGLEGEKVVEVGGDGEL